MQQEKFVEKRRRKSKKECRMEAFGMKLEFRKLKQKNNTYSFIDPTFNPSKNHKFI